MRGVILSGIRNVIVGLAHNAGALALTPLLPLSYLSTYCHEQAHALAMKALFVNVNPKIEIIRSSSPFNLYGGSTDWGGRGTKLTSLGKFLGKNYSRACIDIAGPFAEFFGASLSFGASYLTQDFSWTLTALLLSQGVVSCLENLGYALNDLVFKQVKGGDFTGFTRRTGVSSRIVLLALGLQYLAALYILTDTFIRYLDEEPLLNNYSHLISS